MSVSVEANNDNNDVDDTNQSQFSQNQLGHVESFHEDEDSERDVSGILDDMFDIDICDLESVQACAAYVREIYENLIEMEKDFILPVDFMSKQVEFTLEDRTLLYNWMNYIHTYFNLANESFFHACLIMDHYLSKKVLQLDRSRLIGMAVLMISAKYEQSYIPSLSVFAKALATVESRYLVPCICLHNTTHNEQAQGKPVPCKRCTIAALIEAEQEVLDVLQYRLAMPTAIAFLRRYAKISDLSNRDRYISFYIAELCLLSPRMTKYRPSELAAGCVAMTRRLIRKPGWDETMSRYSSYSEGNVKRVISDVSTTLKECALSPKCKYITKKYHQERFYSVAALIADVVQQALNIPHRCQQ